MLLSEHRLYYLADIADEYCVMANGEIKRKYTAEEAKALSREQLHTLCLRTLDLSGIAVLDKTPLPADAPQALAVSDLRYTYGSKAGAILSGVNFSVREREIVGLVGTNGCGKTTVGKLITGLTAPPAAVSRFSENRKKPDSCKSRRSSLCRRRNFSFSLTLFCMNCNTDIR